MPWEADRLGGYGQPVLEVHFSDIRIDNGNIQATLFPGDIKVDGVWLRYFFRGFDGII